VKLHHHLATVFAKEMRHKVNDPIDFVLTACTRSDGSTLVVLAGELDLHSVPALAEALQAATGPVVVDLQEVTFIDSTTLARLVREHRRLQASGRQLTILVGEQTPMTVFGITGIDRILNIRSCEPPSPVADSRAA